MPTPVLLALYWFFALAALGTFFPLFALYLSENLGLRGSEVGVVTAVLPLSGVLAQPLWGALADRSGSRVRILALVSAGAALGYLLISMQRSFGAVLVATAVLALCSTSVMPMAVSVSLALLREGGQRAFGWVRAAGTLGYLVAVAGFPFLIDTVGERVPVVESPGHLPSEPGMVLMLGVAAGMMAVAAMVATRLPTTGAVALRAERGDLRRLLRNGPYLRLLGVCFGIYALLHGPLVLFPLFVRSLDGGLDAVSHMWIFMLVLEIPLMIAATSLRRGFGARGLIAMGLAADSLRWLISALSPSLVWVYAAQVLHGPAVVGFVIGTALYVEAIVPGRLRSTAQGLVYMVGVSLSGVVSSLVAGLVTERYGPSMPALVGGAGAAALLVALPWLLPAGATSRAEADRSMERDS